MGKGRGQRVREGLQISPRYSRRRNRRARYAIGREGKGGSLPREGQAIVQIRGAHWPYRLGLLNRSRSVARDLDADTLKALDRACGSEGRSPTITKSLAAV